MTINKQTVVIGIDDAKIFELTADTSSHLTYVKDDNNNHNVISAPGIQKIELTPSVTEKGLSSDEKILDYYVRTDYLYWAFNSAQISLDVLAILEGGTVSQTPSEPTPPEFYTYSVNQTSMPKYFKLEAQAKYSAGTVGDFHLILYKCKANNVDVQYLASDYAIVSATGVAIPTTHDGRIKDYVINGTATNISTT